MDIIQQCMTMIANAGEAKAHALESLSLARKKKFEEADAKLTYAQEKLVEGNKAHSNLLFHEAQDNEVMVTVFLLHAADHLNNSNVILTLIGEMIKNMKEGM